MYDKSHAAEIRAQNVCKMFGTFSALDDISLTVERGEFLTLLGPSGSGKTTFLMTLAGFEAPTAGSITLDGRDVTNLPPESRGFGMVFQGYALFPHMTVEQNIAFPLKVQKRSRTEIKARVAEMVEMVGLGGHAHKRPDALSGGQQQRVALARALACEPPALLLDEPFSALDKNLRGQMQDEMRRLHTQTGTTFIFVTHDQSEALALSTHIAIFEAGKLQQVDAPQDIYEHPQNRFVAEFLGDINILSLEKVSPDGDLASGLFEGQQLRAPIGTKGSANVLAIRPEHMRLSAKRPEVGNSISATVTNITYLGAQTRLDLASQGGTGLSLTLDTASLPDGTIPGAALCVNWPEQHGYFLHDQ
ncbi:MAG: ABC transporter ATP-binding protein [Aestuariivita sp.]|jgi:putative spermidine/putrescine transport system ATP-binding protein|nr:ABC transporter ATP-binding protein [Aestuariivita sp.]